MICFDAHNLLVLVYKRNAYNHVLKLFIQMYVLKKLLNNGSNTCELLRYCTTIAGDIHYLNLSYFHHYQRPGPQVHLQYQQFLLEQVRWLVCHTCITQYTIKSMHDRTKCVSVKSSKVRMHLRSYNR